MLSDSAEVLQKIQRLLPTIPGWCSIDKARRLVAIIIEIRPDVCVEIGVFGGSSLVPQAMALKRNGRGVIYGIDPWETDAALEGMVSVANKDWWSTIDLQTIRMGCEDLIRLENLSSYCQLLKAKAEEVSDQFQDNSIDLLHIDGNHSEEKSLKDVNLYLPKVRDDGFIFFDDVTWYDGEKITTTKARELLRQNCEELEIVGDCAVFQKTKKMTSRYGKLTSDSSA